MTAPTESRRSMRGQRQRGEEAPGAMEQIRMVPSGVTGGWCYYLRPDGATIREALVISPNGGVPDLEDSKMRARYGANASEYRSIAQGKGFIPLGPVLTPQAVRQLVEVLADNREDTLLFCEEEIEKATGVLETAHVPAVKDQAGRRIGQFQKMRDTMLAPFDADALLEELNEIAQAQRLASVDPNVLRVMREMVGEVNDKLAGMVSRFSAGKNTTSRTTGVGDDGLGAAPVRGTRTRQKDAGAEFSGVDFIDVDN